MEEEFQNQVQHFKNLKSKYSATTYNDLSPSSLLYLILQKFDMGVKLTQFELNWLKEHKLFETVENILKEEQHRAEAIIKLENQFYHLKSQYKVPSYWNGFKNDISAPLFPILWKLNSENQITDEEIEWLKQNQMFATVTVIEEMELQKQFISLKEKYHATKHSDSSPYNPLHIILKKLDQKIRLENAEVEWLLNHGLVETIEIFKQQETEREVAFAQLKETYQATKYADESASSELYFILQKLDANEDLTYSEMNWLEKHGLYETIAIANDLEKQREFAILKTKYKADCNENYSPHSHLYEVLRSIDTDNLLQEEDINFLKNQNLYETIAIANEKYARSLKSRVVLGWSLSDVEIEWLKNNNYDYIITFAQHHHFITLKRKFGIADTKNQLPFEPFYKIMLKLEEKQRLDPLSVTHLMEKNLLSAGEKIAIAYYRLEAEFYEREFHRTGDQWHIPTTSDCWRKADEPERALSLTNVEFEKIQDEALKSAILVARGTAFRDMLDLINAEIFAQKAIECHSESYKPYILLGSISYDRCNYLNGDLFFKEAMQRGAKAEEIDDEIRQTLNIKTNEKQRQNTLEYLLKKDSERYSWAKFYQKRSKDKGIK